MEEIFLTTYDNLKLAANRTATGHKDVIILVHGWFMSKDSKPFLDMAKALSKNFDVISIDCRGHGKSQGTYTFTQKECNDLNTVIKYAQNLYKNIFLIGLSLGAAIVLQQAVQNSEKIKKVIAVSPPSKFDKIENRFWHYNAWIPTIKKCELKTWFSVRADIKSLVAGKKTNPQEFVSSLKTPVLYIAGEKDPTVCPWHTKNLYDKTNCTKQLKIFKNGIHAEDLFLDNKEEFIKTCENWLLT